MKKLLKIAGYVLAAVLILVSGALIYVKSALPKVDAPEPISFTYTPERIAHGKYLANHVSACMDCHSTRDFSKFSGPLTPGTLGKGGERFDQKAGLPGLFVARNITPAGISRYTDGELLRVITTGVTKEGRAMFPLMPYRILERWIVKMYTISLPTSALFQPLRIRWLSPRQTFR